MLDIINSCLISGAMHPSLRVLTLLIFALAVYGMQSLLLSVVLLVMLATMFAVDLNNKNRLAAGVCRFPALGEWMKLLRRVRYILLFLLLVYACNTPGEYVASWHFPITPTYEGIVSGLEQVLRLAAILAGLALLLAMTSRDQLIAGLYWLARPLRFAGIDAERFAVRLWLTLYYVEHGMRNQQQNSLQQLMTLENMLDSGHNAPERIEIMKPPMRPFDGWVLLGLILTGVVLSCA